MTKALSVLTVCVLVMIGNAAFAQRQFELLTGWGWGKPEEICPKAAEIGFDEIIVWSRSPNYLRHLIEVARRYGIDVYASVYLNDIKAWKKRYPDVPPPLQVMSAEENAVLQRLKNDKRPGKGGYQFGGEPLPGHTEVLLYDMLCFHRPEVVEFMKAEIKDVLTVEGLNSPSTKCCPAAAGSGRRSLRCEILTNRRIRLRFRASISATIPPPRDERLY